MVSSPSSQSQHQQSQLHSKEANRLREPEINHADALHRRDQLFWLFYDCATNLSRGATEVCGEKDALQARPVRQLGIRDVSLAEAVTMSDASDRATFLWLISYRATIFVREPVCEKRGFPYTFTSTVWCFFLLLLPPPTPCPFCERRSRARFCFMLHVQRSQK